MSKSASIWLGLVLVTASVSADAQTVTGSGTTNTVPVFTGTSTVGNSPIAVSTSNVGIGTTSPQATLDVRGVISSGNAPSTSGSVILEGYYGSGALSVLGSEASSGAPIIGYAVDPSSAGGFLSATSVGVPRAALIVGDSVSGVGSGMITFYAAGLQTTAIGSAVAMSPTMAILNNGNIGIGTTNPQAKLEVNGSLRFTADGSVQTTAWTGVLCGGDYAEAVDAAGDKKAYEPGDVLVLASDGKSDVAKSSEAYSTMVAGIYATKPGVIGRRQFLPKDEADLPMAMIGIVPTKVSAENGPIHRGDLLVSSSTPGFAMKGTDRTRLVGAVIGKAMGSLESGTGVIEVLVTLQ